MNIEQLLIYFFVNQMFGNIRKMWWMHWREQRHVKIVLKTKINKIHSTELRSNNKKFLQFYLVIALGI